MDIYYWVLKLVTFKVLMYMYNSKEQACSQLSVGEVKVISVDEREIRMWQRKRGSCLEEGELIR